MCLNNTMKIYNTKITCLSGQVKSKMNSLPELKPLVRETRWVRTISSTTSDKWASTKKGGLYSNDNDTITL